MALGLEALKSYCDPEKLIPAAARQDVFLLDGVEPYRCEGITEQFLENASTYHERYFNPGHFAELLDEAFRRTQFPLHGARHVDVLDLGSGSGNTVVPLLSREASVRVVATDLSIDLLVILATLAQNKPFQDRLGFVCADANRKGFHENAFDLVVGGSILHHLMEPASALTTCLSYLRPGGLAIFFEPFEYGANILKTIYQCILDDPRCQDDIDPAVHASFVAMIRDYNARFDAEQTKPYTKYLDDKWLFTRRFFATTCRHAGCHLLEIYNNMRSEMQFTELVLTNLRLAGLGAHALPSWVLDITSDFDRRLGPRLCEQLVMDGTIIMKKG
jgi:SAM-dependent methyltransferase